MITFLKRLKVSSQVNMKVQSNPRVSIKQTKKMKKKVQITPNVSASLYVAQELKFIKCLAGNDPRLSEKELKKLGKWLQLRSNSSNPFSDQDIIHLWKGLFFCMWMSDKPLTQEKLAENLASLLHSFDKKDVSIRFYGAFLKIMGKEWFGIDQWRIDKFMMLVRRVTRQIFVVLHGHKWDKKLIKQLNEHVEKSILDKSTSIGFLMHFTEIFLDELAKVSVGKISRSKVTLLLQPFAMCVATQRDPKIVAHTIKHIFDGLLYQSDLGRAYTEKFEAWKNMGFPGTSIDELEQVSDENANDTASETADSDDEGDESNITSAMDPRAGRVDVVVPEIPFDPEDIIKKLEQYKNGPCTNVKSRKTIRKIIDRYTTFATGKFPLGIQNMKINETPIDMPNIEDKAQEMIDFETELHQPSRDIKKLNKKKRKKVLSGAEVVQPAKKAKICKVDDPKLKKKKSVETDQWVETDLTPEEISVDVSNSCPDQSMNGSSADPDMENVINSTTGPFTVTEGWDTPLQEGEVEYFISKSNLKQRIGDANKKQTNLDDSQSKQFSSPAAGRKHKLKATTLTSTPTPTPSTPNGPSTPSTPSNAEKKVKIMLQLNRSQDTSEYIRQLRSSPKIPYDSAKKPGRKLKNFSNKKFD
ncbi:ribosomal RNA processing protein 1 homolog isoform X2 [Bradysia coprophila]|uniref:ribosomal RNA processing protein 1 homolog isoform X2 n=1 Tax=Bradysia coprophila TaxID=38358 RepID=UPI00187D8903|nr:ribosomal RNA processing protein 1 homolog isoform X2 [Bradysia coprophila]